MAMKYDELLSEILQLDPREQARLVEAISQHLSEPMMEPPRHSILELRGLGKEVWQGIDAQEYVRRERASWEE
jgi:hypothetical protein